MIERLVSCHEAGQRPADDPQLGAHLGSCLGCFRAAADLREVPRLAALLRETATAAPESPPEPHFWSSLPVQLGQAFERALDRAGDGVRAADDARPTWWRRFVAWIRMPVPAAMAGAACATAVALVMTRPPSLQTMGRPAPLGELGQLGSLGEDAPGPAANPGALGQDDLAFAQTASLYDSVEELDSRALARVRDAFGVSFEEALDPEAQLAADDDDPGVGGTSTAPNPATVSDELDELDEGGLAALRAELSDRMETAP